MDPFDDLRHFVRWDVLLSSRDDFFLSTHGRAASKAWLPNRGIVVNVR
jgi:hypothetical protein